MLDITSITKGTKLINKGLIVCVYINLINLAPFVYHIFTKTYT